MPNITTIIFDCFGVLYPTFDGDFIEAHKTPHYDPRILDELNLQIDLGRITKKEFFDRLASSLDVPASLMQHEKEAAQQPDLNLVELIRKNTNKYTFAILSNAGEEEIAIIYKHKIDDLFTSITVSSEVGDVKPNPQIYTTCLKRLNVQPQECLFVDDNPKNLVTAQSLGMHTLHYPEFGSIPAELAKLLT